MINTAVISLLFSSTATSPRVSRFSTTNALTTWYARWRWLPLSQIVLPSMATTLPSARWPEGQSCRHSAGFAGLRRSNTRWNVSLSGMLCCSSRKCFTHSCRASLNSSISTKSLLLQIRLHSPIMMIYLAQSPLQIFELHAASISYFLCCRPGHLVRECPK